MLNSSSHSPYLKSSCCTFSNVFLNNSISGIAGDEKLIEDILSDEEEININDENKNIDGEKKDDKKKEITRKGEDSNKHTRRSERIRKQRVEVHSDDIGDNDDENDKNYK